MKRSMKITFLLIIGALLFTVGCSSVTKVDPSATLGLKIPEPEPLGPAQKQMDFEEVVKGKVWYSKLEGDETLDHLYQTVIQFNTSSKTLKKENYRWDRYGRTNTYKLAGTDYQTANYLYGLLDGTIEYQLNSDYTVNANSSRLNNFLDTNKNTASFAVISPELILWDGEQFYLKQAMDKHLIENYTTKREFTINQ